MAKALPAPAAAELDGDPFGRPDISPDGSKSKRCRKTKKGKARKKHKLYF